MKPDEIKKHFPTEAALCAAFIAEANALAGWVCYPETAGFDILMVHESGRQIGIEAKLSLNAKVIDQILPEEGFWSYDRAGPGHRAVLIPALTDANRGLAKMLGMLGASIWTPWLGQDYRDGKIVDRIQFNLDNALRYDAAAAVYDDSGMWARHALFDWNPPERCPLPPMVPDLPAGVPSPIQMTPWKQGALRVLAILRRDGRITAKEITRCGNSPSTWTQRWLRRGDVPGMWVPTEETPWQHTERHSAEFEVALAALDARRAGVGVGVGAEQSELMPVRA